jgi:hypothetical protein
VHIRVEHAVELLLMQDEQMIEALTPYTAEEPLTDGIRARGVIRSFKNLNVTRLSNPSEAHTPNLPSLSRMRYLGPTPKAVASRSCCAVQASMGYRVTPTWITLRECSSMMKKANSEWKKRSVTGRKSQAQICSA